MLQGRTKTKAKNDIKLVLIIQFKVKGKAHKWHLHLSFIFLLWMEKCCNIGGGRNHLGLSSKKVNSADPLPNTN